MVGNIWGFLSVFYNSFYAIGLWGYDFTAFFEAGYAVAVYGFHAVLY